MYGKGMQLQYHLIKTGNLLLAIQLGIMNLMIELEYLADVNY